ncbi:hypothetical protein [Robiginitalea sp. SC105]|uniref:hypothetical protein n=1 Tax=Robiginitalea sp. SC105 TaxID=2762332 RepID=UPI00163AAC9F|nr:hypothetical protein [Robiginitalea sp. SC105]MBC2839716.1 hypothetical protein [Robiginitalea sp. SC105]
MVRLLLCLALLVFPWPGKAWVYPEHRQISYLAIQQLGPEYRRILDEIWAQVRIGYEDRLSPSILDPGHGLDPEVLDFASWPAIAGDHSCSPEQMMDIILASDWILRVDHIATRLQNDLAKAQRPDQTINAIRNSDIRLQRADSDYATRAGTNNVHFLLARTTVAATAGEYFNESLQEGAPLNALGAYGYFHTRAMERVAQSNSPNLTREQRSAILLAAMANEAFALHFLEDAFAAGHVVGSWGNAAQRKGTHDHYNEAGLEVETWDEQRLVLTGDAYMRPADALVVAKAVQTSLEQFCQAMLEGRGGTLVPPGDLEILPDTFDVCANNNMPIGLTNRELLDEVLLGTPTPGLVEGLGQLARFRTELGPFIGASSSVETGWLNGGFGPGQEEQALIGSIEANLVFGLGLDGVMNKAGDGLAFIQVGWRQDSPTTSQFTDPSSTIQGSSVTATIPGRSAYNLRVRMPFWLIPGDLILGAAIFSWASPKTLERMAVTAGNGGFIPWQSGISTGIGRFQFVLGREVGVSFYGVRRIQESLVIPNRTFNETSLVAYRSTKWDFPFLEYQPTRTFSNTQSASLKVQFSVGVDVPWRERTLAPANADAVDLESVWYMGMRLVYHWRRYF